MLMRHLNWFFTGSDEDGVLDSLGKSRAVCCGLPRMGNVWKCHGQLELELEVVIWDLVVQMNFWLKYGPQVLVSFR